jgi:hypothetical protein
MKAYQKPTFAKTSMLQRVAAQIVVSGSVIITPP